MHDDPLHMTRLEEHRPEIYSIDNILNSIDRGRIACGRFADKVKKVKVDMKKKVVIEDGDTGESGEQQKDRRHNGVRKPRPVGTLDLCE